MSVLKKFVVTKPKSKKIKMKVWNDSNSTFSVTMCPLCANCSTWPLHQICDYTRIAYLFDHPGTIFYAVFMSFWGEYLEFCWWMIINELRGIRKKNNTNKRLFYIKSSTYMPNYQEFFKPTSPISKKQGLAGNFQTYLGIQF